MLHFPIVNNIMSSFSSYSCVSVLKIPVFSMMLDGYACRVMFLCFDDWKTLCVGFHCPHSRLFHRPHSLPTLRMDGATSRKLQLPLENAMEHPRLEDVVLSPSLGLAIHDDEVKPMGGVHNYTMAPHLGASATRCLARLEDNGSCGLQSMGPR